MRHAKFKLFAAFVFAFALSACISSPTKAGPVPITCVHAHNDYEHTHPLFDALEQGFCSVEADIHLVDGKLLVAHDRKNVDPSRTLETLYLEPLRQIVKRNGGHVYPNGPECTLLIDFKSEGVATYAVLRKVLEEYSDILSVFGDGKKQTNAVTAVLTGGYSRKALAADDVRYAAGDGKLPDLGANPPANLVPWLSEKWTDYFTWDGVGTMPEDERQFLKGIVERAHRQGRVVRFWGSPDQANFWRELMTDGVDLINTDDLKGFRRFYEEGRKGNSK